MTSPAAPDADPADTDRPVNRWAVATFLLGLVSLVPLSVIAGIVTFVTTRGTKEAGRGLAVAGLVISALWVAIWGYIEWPKDGLITGPIQSDRVGTCFQETINSPVSCDKPHSDELFAMLKLSRFPDSDHEQQQIENRCKAELPKYSATAVRDPGIQVHAWSPGTEWKQLDSHAAGCIAHTRSERVGSIKLGPAFSWNSP
jgi:Septum formation